MLDNHQLSCFVFGLKIYNMKADKSSRIFEKHKPHLGIQTMYHYVKEIRFFSSSCEDSKLEEHDKMKQNRKIIILDVFGYP